jgi:undecaprenyl diphosphate synthase
MDGNGRWAAARGLPRPRGHREGIEAAKRFVVGAISHGIPFVSLYAFSTENWRRAADEVSFIMGLVARNLRSQYGFYRKNNIRVRHSGNISGLPPEVKEEIHAVSEETLTNTAITINLAINYGGRDEIVRAINRWQECNSSEKLTEDALQTHLDLPDIPYPDLIIRTGGDKRMSNFLLWQAAYAELYFSDLFWPDWNEEELGNALTDFAQRKRNYGGMR